MTARETKKTPEEPDFEQALARLEALVKQMESGTLTLDQMMKCFEEGSELAKLCDRKLNEVEKRVEKLLKQDGQTATEPFAPASDGEHT